MSNRFIDRAQQPGVIIIGWNPDVVANVNVSGWDATVVANVQRAITPSKLLIDQAFDAPPSAAIVSGPNAIASGTQQVSLWIEYTPGEVGATVDVLLFWFCADAAARDTGVNPGTFGTTAAFNLYETVYSTLAAASTSPIYLVPCFNVPGGATAYGVVFIETAVTTAGGLVVYETTST